MGQQARDRARTFPNPANASELQRLTFAPLSTGQITALTDAYHAGAAVKDLAIEFGVQRTTVTQHLRRNGVSLRRRGLDDHKVGRAVHLYRQGWSLTGVGTRLHVDAHTVRTALRARGVRMRGTHGRD